MTHGLVESCPQDVPDDVTAYIHTQHLFMYTFTLSCIYTYAGCGAMNLGTQNPNVF